MLRLALVLFVLGVSSGLAACKRDQAAPAPAATTAETIKDPKLRALLTLADETCACTTYACADAKTKEIFDKMGALLGATADAKEGAEVRKAVQRAAACKAKLPRDQAAAPPAGAPAGAPAPPAGAPAPPASAPTPAAP